MPPSPNASVVSIDVNLRPDELVGAWRADSRHLMIPSRQPLKLQQRVAARITAVGLGVAATITGRVVSASPQGSQYRVEIVPDETRVRAVEKLLAIARGEPVDFRRRAPRFLATMPAVVCGAVGPTYMTTATVSENGCGLVWTGPLPAIGVPLEIRVGAGSRAVVFHGVVCSTAQMGRTTAVGVRFVNGHRNAWAMMLTDVKMSGAPLA
jgi:hypothetical protein